MHRLQVVDSNEMIAMAAAEVETEDEDDSSSSDELVHDIDELRGATPTTIWHLRLCSLERWYPLPCPTDDGSLFWTDLQQKFHLAYAASRMGIFPHRILYHTVLTRAIDMTREQITELFSYQPGLDFLLTLPGHYTKGLVRVFYATVWIDSEHQFLCYMFKAQSHQL